MEKFDLKKLTENKPMFYTIVGCVAVVVIMFIFMIITLISVGNMNTSSNNQDKQLKVAEKVIKNEDFIRGFSINNNQLVCKNIGPSSANGTNSITINGKDEDWSGIYPLFKAENLNMIILIFLAFIYVALLFYLFVVFPSSK